MNLQALSDDELIQLSQRSQAVQSLSDEELAQLADERGLASEPPANSDLVNLGRGFKTAIEGVQQLGNSIDPAARTASQFGFDANNPAGNPERAADLSVERAERREAFTENAVLERDQFMRTPAASAPGAARQRFIGELAPGVTIGGGGRRLAERALSEIAIGAGLGAAQFQDDESERVGATGLSGVVGGGLQLAAGGARVLNRSVSELLGAKTARRIQELGGETLEASTLKRLEAAERLGLSLTPAEATGDAVLAARQGSLGSTTKGSEELVRRKQARLARERQIITNFLSGVSPEPGSAAVRIKRAAERIIGDEKTSLARLAQPLYEKAYLESIDTQALERLMDDPVIKHEFEVVMRTPAFQRELGDASLESIKTIDVVKRSLDDRYEVLVARGKDNEARILLQASTDMLSIADSASPSYADARAIFSRGSPRIQALENSAVGRISRVRDDNLRAISRRLFDPSETNTVELARATSQLAKADPDGLRQLLRNEMERRLDALRGEATGGSFFNAMLAKDRDFRQFLIATKSMPEVRRALVDMRRAFKDLTNPTTVRTAERLAKSSLEAPRSTGEFLMQTLGNMSGGLYDRAGIEIITDPRWSRELTNALGEAKQPDRIAALGRLLSRIQSTQVGRDEEG